MTGENGIYGEVTFSQDYIRSSVYVHGYIQGLARGFHGFHIHQFGNLTEECRSIGSHFNLEHTNHGGPYEDNRHTGDLGNIRVRVRVLDNFLNARYLQDFVMQFFP